MRKTYWARFFEDDEGRGWTVDAPDLPGCITEGRSWDEALYMAAEAVKFWLEDEVENGRPLPAARSREEAAAAPAADGLGEPRLAEITVGLFDTLPEALWADLAKVSRRENRPVDDLLALAVREFLGRRLAGESRASTE